MGEILDAGYKSLKDYLASNTPVPNNWDYIEIYDDTGTAVTRVSITSDSRCEWKDVNGDKTLKIEFVVTGADSDIPLPVTLSSSAIWDGSSGTQMTAKESFADALLNQNGDEATITHTIKVPK